LAENVGTLNNNMTTLMASTIGSTDLNEYWSNYDYSLNDRIDILDDINNVYNDAPIMTISATAI